MRYFGYWTILVALSISAVAAYYSIVGLVAIFASAIVPIIIMGTVLEIGKLTSAVWLHLHWRQAPILIKTYLSVAVVLLMFITSMGIFGFLSKAHIEQTSLATENVALIERIDTSIAREKTVIQKADDKIIKLETLDTSIDDELQQKIREETTRIENAYKGVQPSIDEQNEIIKELKDESKVAELPFKNQIESIDNQLKLIEQYIANEEIKKLQGLIGASQDGRYGSKTAKAVKDFRETKTKDRQVAIFQLNKIRDNNDDQVIKDARTEIKRLRALAEQQIADSNELITRLRAQLGQGQQDDSTDQILTQRSIITDATATLDGLYEEKFELEGQSRALEAEVGPVKYIAELIYGSDPTRSMLEDAVRFVILLLVLVFDPLAIVLVISGITLVERFPRPSKTEINTIYEETQEDEMGDNEDRPSIEEDDTSDKEDETISPEPVVQDEVPAKEVEVFTDKEGKEYTINEKGRREYLLDAQQYDLNNKSKKTLKKDKQELVTKIVAEMRSTGSWPGSGHLQTEGVIKKKIEDIFADDASLELKELISRADQTVLTQVYKEMIKDTNNDN